MGGIGQPARHNLRPSSLEGDETREHPSKQGKGHYRDASRPHPSPRRSRVHRLSRSRFRSKRLSRPRRDFRTGTGLACYHVQMFRFRIIRRRTRRRVPAGVRREYLAYKETARARIRSFLDALAPKYGVQPRKVSIRAQRTRWGSASRSGSLSFNYRIAFLPERLAAYIVAHELSHLLEHNHGKRFWAHVARTIPDHHGARRELRAWERRYPYGRPVKVTPPEWAA